MRRMRALAQAGMAPRRARRLLRAWVRHGERRDRPADAPGTVPDHDDIGGGAGRTLTDPEALEYRRHRRQLRERQEVVRDLASVSRGQPVSEVAATLQRVMAVRLRTPMPRTWVDAVARDAAAGHVYIVDEVAQHDAGVELRRTGKE